MNLRIFITLTLIAFIFNHCENSQFSKRLPENKKNNTSKIEYFEYGGYGDSNLSIIYGNVYEPEKKENGTDTLKPLSTVEIRLVQNNKSVQTDSNGRFEIGVEKGIFSFTVLKKGYEPITLTNFVSDPDQVSNTKIILVKGNKPRTFKIQDWKL